MRVSTNSMVRKYNTSLSSSLNTLNISREKVYTGKQFTKSYQDPAASLRVSDLHRRYLKTDTYISTVKDAQSRQDSADSSLQQMVGIVGESVIDKGLQAITGTSSQETRSTYAASLRKMQETLLQSANATYGDKYLFAGADGSNMPFALDANGEVTYRGINVTTGAWAGGTDAQGLQRLKELSGEKLYFDIGLGLQVDNPSGVADTSSDFNGASAYDMAINGIKCLGYGSVDGSAPPISKNIIALVGQMATELESGSFDETRFGDMLSQLKETHSGMTDYNAEMGVRANTLETTLDRLKTDKLNIYTQMDNLENIQPAEAITDYSYSQYCYNLILKVGTNLLSNSFIDFMR